jgi:hypothetical protein
MAVSHENGQIMGEKHIDFHLSGMGLWIMGVSKGRHHKVQQNQQDIVL